MAFIFGYSTQTCVDPSFFATTVGLWGWSMGFFMAQLFLGRPSSQPYLRPFLWDPGRMVLYRDTAWLALLSRYQWSDITSTPKFRFIQCKDILITHDQFDEIFPFFASRSPLSAGRLLKSLLFLPNSWGSPWIMLQHHPSESNSKGASETTFTFSILSNFSPLSKNKGCAQGYK